MICGVVKKKNMPVKCRYKNNLIYFPENNKIILKYQDIYIRTKILLKCYLAEE